MAGDSGRIISGLMADPIAAEAVVTLDVMCLRQLFHLLADTSASICPLHSLSLRLLLLLLHNNNNHLTTYHSSPSSFSSSKSSTSMHLRILIFIHFRLQSSATSAATGIKLLTRTAADAIFVLKMYY